jgi:aminoglycoside phosphotransferase (APT) family kinase protein
VAADSAGLKYERSGNPVMATRARVVTGLDETRVSRWLVNAGLELRAPFRFRRVGLGRSNLTFLVEDRLGESLVLRRPPLGELLESAHDIGREFVFLTMLSAAGQPVPRPVARCDDLSITNSCFYLMEYVPGIVAESEHIVRCELSVPARAATGPALGRTLARLQRADTTDSVFRQTVTTTGAAYAQRQIRRWLQQWERSKSCEVPLIDDVAHRLAAAPPIQREVTIVHGDYGLHNAVIDRFGEVRAILDWEMATLGDPQADLAWLLMLWPESGDQVVAGPEPVSLMPGFGPRSRIIDAYVEESGRSPDDLAYWLALSYWKLAIAIAGIHKRWLQDPASGGDGAELLGAQVEPLAVRAADAADEAGL